MQSAKIAHYTHHFPQSCSTHNHSTNSNTVEQNERLFQIDTSCVLICLFFLDSNHLNCQDTYDTQWIQYHSSSHTQTLSVTIQNLLYQRYMFVLALTITSCIILLKDTLLYFHHIPLLESDGYVLSQYMAHSPTVDRLNRYIIKMIPLCSFICVCIYMHLQHIHLFTFL